MSSNEEADIQMVDILNPPYRFDTPGSTGHTNKKYIGFLD